MSHPYVSAWQKAKVVQYRHLLCLALQPLVVVIFGAFQLVYTNKKKVNLSKQVEYTFPEILFRIGGIGLI